MSKREVSESIVITEMILEQLRIQPLYRHDLANMYDLNRSDMNNFLTRLKKHELIKIYPQDMKKPANSRRWIATDKTGTYQDCLVISRRISTESLKPNFKKIEFSPFANPAMCRTSESYHTKGNYEKVSAWTGYESMGGM